ncbi:uncharacterized protein DNG_00841 [Cephalotrichum gorgonifer]|uniref:M protein, serotype 2.1 n=1 Tax=Cephalotrichum gorgonifer TaxID=2041049 RepID=A0AAE8MPW7_9PEZI|nr:uncharacterized protein DNG_00841 [Cephalotrichum gorgonifer]
MSTHSKKISSAGVNRISNTESSASPQTSPSRQAPRSSTPTSNTPTRTRSVRTGTPVSARGAAVRRESLLGNAATEAQQQAREEAAAVMEDLRERLANAESAAENSRKQLEVLQSRFEDTTKEQAKLEERLHEAEEQIEALTNEKREAARQTREMETIYEAERSSMMKEKEEMANREEEMQAVIKRLKDSLANKNANPSEDESRASRQVEGGNFAPPSSLNRSDSRNNSKLLLQKDKLIESLRLELAEAQIKLVESENQGGGRLQEVERLLMEARMANARLMEDNESYQLLLQERTLNGEFKSSLAFMGGSAANEDALKALEGRNSGTTLADELSEAVENEATDQARLEADLKALKEENKALVLYIDKTLGKVLGHPEFMAILDQSTAEEKSSANKNKDLPPPPLEKDQQWAGSSIFQRAKFTVAGAAASKTRQRPVSVMPTSTNSVHNNPETAPKIPIGNLTRSTSVRRARPMSEQFTGGHGGTSGLLGQRYRGADGPGSPTFSEPRRSQTYFGTAGSRSPSGQHAAAPSSGNFPGMRSETSSMSGDSADVVTPPSQSPPRHSDKGTTFTGNKVRPLRLLQEQEPPKTSDTNKRASWINWSGWGPKKDEAPPSGAIAE